MTYGIEKVKGYHDNFFIDIKRYIDGNEDFYEEFDPPDELYDNFEKLEHIVNLYRVHKECIREWDGFIDFSESQFAAAFTIMNEKRMLFKVEERAEDFMERARRESIEYKVGTQLRLSSDEEWLEIDHNPDDYVDCWDLQSQDKKYIYLYSGLKISKWAHDEHDKISIKGCIASFSLFFEGKKVGYLVYCSNSDMSLIRSNRIWRVFSLSQEIFSNIDIGRYRKETILYKLANTEFKDINKWR